MTGKSRLFFLTASALGFLSVALGAFGAHGLEDLLSERMLEVFKTGVQYQMFHVVALFAVSALCYVKGEEFGLLNWSGYLFTAGVILFSGSLYLLSITGITILGIITPIGGVALLLAWLFLFLAVYKQAGNES